MAAKQTATVSDVKIAARGQWLRIFAELAGYVIEPPTSKREGPCPKCGGDTRFRVVDVDNGVLFCNQCFSKRNGDGLAALCWLMGKTNSGKDFAEVLKAVAEFLGVKSTANRKGKPENQRVFATSKGIALYFQQTLSRQTGGPARLVKTWAYDTFWVLRYNLPTPDGEKQRKEFRQIQRVPLGLSGDTGFTWGYPPGKRPVYLRKQIGAASTDLLTVHAGEKAADAAVAMGLVATTNAGGEKSIDQTDWSPVFRFTTIAIVVDNDPAGESYGAMLALRLRKVKPEIDVRIIKLPDLPPKGDVVEWIAAGGSRERFLEVVAGTDRAVVANLGPVEEADDDPHRLARVNLERYATNNAGRTLRYWRDEWYACRNCYAPITDGEFRAKLSKSIRDEFEQVAQDRKAELEAMNKNEDREDKKEITVRKVTTGLVSNVIQATSGMVCVPSRVELGTWLPTMESKPWVSLQNGILDIEAVLAGRPDYLRENSPEWFSTVTLPYDYNPAATCPTWLEFLEYNLELDPERIKLLQEWAGYLLLADTGQQKFLVLEGEGANGKSVYIAGITAMLGEANVSTVPLEVFGDRFSRTATLGKLLNAAGDCGEIDKASEGYIKSFTSGDRMFFDRKNRDGLNCRPTARLMIGCNNRPRFSDKSDGVWRRMLLVPWRITIDPQKRIIGMDKADWWKDSGDLPGMLNWAIEGLRRLRAQKRFTTSKLMDDAMEDYRAEVNPARSFLQQQCQMVDLGQISGQELYGKYQEWSHANGYNHPLGNRAFGKEVGRVFPLCKRKRESSGERKWFYEYLAYNDGF
jgi:P4 family phage/plasmid primase-like protien